MENKMKAFAEELKKEGYEGLLTIKKVNSEGIATLSQGIYGGRESIMELLGKLIVGITKEYTGKVSAETLANTCTEALERLKNNEIIVQVASEKEQHEIENTMECVKNCVEALDNAKHLDEAVIRVDISGIGSRGYEVMKKGLNKIMEEEWELDYKEEKGTKVCEITAKRKEE